MASGTVNSRYYGHPRDRDLVSVIARVRNSGVRANFIWKHIYSRGLHVFSFSLAAVPFPDPFSHVKSVRTLFLFTVPVMASPQIRRVECKEYYSWMRGHHAYKDIFEPVIGTTLTLQREPENAKDPHAVAIVADTGNSKYLEDTHLTAGLINSKGIEKWCSVSMYCRYVGTICYGRYIKGLPFLPTPTPRSKVTGTSKENTEEYTIICCTRFEMIQYWWFRLLLK